MSQSDVKMLDKKIKELYFFIFGGKSSRAYENELEKKMNRGRLGLPFAVFISLCNTKERAHVCHSTGDTLEAAWNATVESARNFLKKNNVEPRWIKVDIVHKAEIKPLQQAVNEMFYSYNEFYRSGISLDKNFRYAFTEAELNGNRLITYKEKCFDLRNLNAYLLKRDDDIKLGMPKELVVFDCDQYFCDEKDNIYKLYSEGLECGRREITELGKKEIKHVINTGVRYLSNQIHDDGSFDYGYYPIFHKLIPGYNILRHTSTIWSMICAAELNKDHDTYQKAMRAIKFLIGNIEHYDGYAYLVEKLKNEVKLGGNAVAIILLTQYMALYENDSYKELCIELGEGILRLFDSQTGKFIHVLNYPDLSVKEEQRTVYYDGEATFALARLYSLTKEQKWLDAAKASVDRFIKDDYTKYRDHWVAYAVNELTKYIPEEKYFEFGLKNVQNNLQKIFNQETTYHTYLELLTASFEMYSRILREGHNVKYMEEFDDIAFIQTIFRRAYHMLNGYGYPEYVMYFKKPSYFNGSFFVRHDGYRTRIDDVQHFCGAYISMYRQYDDIVARYQELVEKNK